MSRRSPLRAAAAALIGLALATAVPMTALAATAPVPANIQYSIDGGATWSRVPPVAWFQGIGTLVPGDVVSRTLTVQSLRNAPTLFQLAVNGIEIANSDLLSAVTIEARDAIGAGIEPTLLSDLGECDALVPNRVLTAGEIVPVTLTLRVTSALAGRAAQDSAGDFTMALGLSDPGPSVAANGCPAAPVTIAGIDSPTVPTAAVSGLAYTGSALVVPSVIVAGVALGVGGLLLAIAARRRRRGEQS